MVQVDTEVCKAAKCEFLDKKLNICSRAMHFRKKKHDVCVSKVDIRVKR